MKNVVFWLAVLVALLLILQIVREGQPSQKAKEISYSQFLSDVSAGKVTKVVIFRNQADGTYRDKTTFRVVVPASQEGMLETLRDRNVEMWFREPGNIDLTTAVLGLVLVLLLAALWSYLARRMKDRQTLSP